MTTMICGLQIMRFEQSKLDAPSAYLLQQKSMNRSE